MDPRTEVAKNSTKSASTCDSFDWEEMPAAPRPKFLELPEDMPELVLEDLSFEEESMILLPEKKRSPTESNRHLSQPRVFAGSDSRASNGECAKNHRGVKRQSTKSTSLILGFIRGSRCESGRDPLRKYSPSSKPVRREEFYSDKNSLLGSTTWWPIAASSSSSR